MKYFLPALTTLIIVILVAASGCTGDVLTKAGVGNFGGTPVSDPAADTYRATAGNAGTAGADAGYADCMNVCRQYSGQTGAECSQTCCISGCSDDSPGGLDSCYYRCLGMTPPATSAGPDSRPADTGAPAGFTCEFDQGLLDTSAEYRTWFNSSCYYNTYCGWWEPVDLQPASSFGQDCINCSIDAGFQPEPTHTPCPARTPKSGPTPTPAVTTTTLSSSGACGQGLTQCRVFSTDYCVDLMTDVKHCGACRFACYLQNANNGCRNGACIIESCLAGWADCNGDNADGCETDLDSDTSNCGQCGRVCSLPHANAICAGEDGNGRCEVEYCLDGYLNNNGYHEDGCEAIEN